MIDERLNHLICGHLDGTLASADRVELEQRLLHSAADRERFWQEAETHAMLHAALQTSIAEEIKPRRVTRQWPSWKPLTAAAAELVIGLFSASLVFGYAMPRAVATASRLFALVDGSFENRAGVWRRGFCLSLANGAVMRLR